MPDSERPTRLFLPIDPSRDHLLGSLDAAVTLLEYGDYECPDCGHFFPIAKQLREHFGDKMLFAFRHFPQYTIHRHASMAAQAAEAAAAEKKFWEMHDLLFAQQDRLETIDLSRSAMRIGLDLYKFESALDTGAYLKRVEEDYSTGERSGVRGTPTLFINRERYAGKVDFESVRAAIEAAI